MTQPNNTPPLLVVDDEEELREALRMTLTAKGYNVVVASSGTAALELLRKRVTELATPYIQAVISDWMMPNGTGLELLSGIRKDKDLRGIPFVLMSGNVTKEDLMGAVRYDLDGVILKPFVTKDLTAKLLEAIEKRDKKELALLMKS